MNLPGNGDDILQAPESVLNVLERGVQGRGLVDGKSLHDKRIPRPWLKMDFLASFLKLPFHQNRFIEKFNQEFLCLVTEHFAVLGSSRLYPLQHS